MSKSVDTGLEALLFLSVDPDERGLAARYAPIILLDRREPFLPLVAGYTLLWADADSASFPRRIELSPPGQLPAALAIEYAIWWDWDIGHLYELEHAWVYVDEAGRVVRGEASWHGWYNDMVAGGTSLPEGERLVLFSEPGKHAFAPDSDWFAERRPREIQRQTSRRVGKGGVLVTPLFESELRRLRRPYANTLVRTYLEQHAFQPAWAFTQRFPVTADLLVPWPALRAWIPGRVAWWIEALKAQTRPRDLRFLRVAHRGASAYAPENTLAAFRKAAELDADMVELDVQVSADGVPVAIHDPVVSRLDPCGGAVGEMTLAQLRTLDAGAGQRIPTLEEAIGCCLAEDLAMYIELKTAAAVRPVVDAIRRHGLHDRAVVASFRADWVAAAKSLDPSIWTSVLFSAPDTDPVSLAQAAAADFVHPCWESSAPEPHRLLTPEWLAYVRQADLGIILWHEERPAEIAALRQIGVDGICSNAPDLLW